MLNLLQFLQEYPLLDHEVQNFETFFYLHREKIIFSFVSKIYLHLFISSTTTASNKMKLANSESPRQIPIIRILCDDIDGCG